MMLISKLRMVKIMLKYILISSRSLCINGLLPIVCRLSHIPRCKHKSKMFGPRSDGLTNL